MNPGSFLICTHNEGYQASLELRKLYEVLPDSRAARHTQVRVVDESGEGYLYPASYFTIVELPQEIAEEVAHAV